MKNHSYIWDVLLMTIIVFGLVFSLSFISAPEEIGTGEEPMEEIAIPTIALEDKAGWTIDNIYSFDDKISLGKAQITSSFLWIIPYDPIEDIELKENTFVCGQYCSAEKEITIYKDTALVDSVRFETILEDGKRVQQDIRNYKFEIRSKHVAKEVEDYFYSCDTTGDYHVNGTAVIDCSNKLTGTHIAYDDTWIPYNYEVMPAGTYYLRLSGEKKPTRSVEWYITSQGREIDEWATWGGVTSLVQDTPTNSATDPQAIFGFYGLMFEPNRDVYLINVTKYADALATTVFLTNCTVGVSQAAVYASANFSSTSALNATFNPPIYLYAGRKYCLEVGNSYTYTGNPAIQRVYTHVNYDPSLQTNVNLNVTHFSANGIIDDDTPGNIINMLTGEILSSLNLTSPANAYTSNNQEVTFISNATQFGATLVNMSLWTNTTGTWARNITIYNTSNNVVFDAMGLNNGVKIGGVVINSTFAKFGLGGADFDGIDNYITVTDSDSLANNYTQMSWSFWIKRYSSVASSGWLDKYQTTGNQRSWRIIQATNLDVALTLSDNLTTGVAYSSTNSCGAETNIWVNINIVYNGTYLLFYKNGALCDSVAVSQTQIVNNNQALLIGTTIVSPKFFNGSIDEVRIFNRTLSQAEITSLYTTNTISDTIGLVSYYNFDTEGNSANLGSSYTWTQPVTFADGGYKWGVQACDSDGDCAFSNENRTFTIDSTAPTVNIIYPTGTLNGLTNGQALGLNYTITHPASNITDCWKEYNGVNTSIANCYGNTSVTYVLGVDSAKIWANDSLNNIGFASTSWSTAVSVKDIKYTSSLNSGESQVFSLNVTSTSILSSANLVYDGTAYSASVTLINSTDSFMTRTINAPIITSPVTKSFYFNLLFNDGSSFNTTTYTQTVSPLYFAFCNATINTPLINFTTRKSSSPFDTVVGSIKAAWSIGPLTAKQNYSYQDLNNNNDSWAFCSNNNNTILADATIEYSSPGYANSIYYINGLSINNNTQRVNLSLLNDTAATLVVIKVVNTAQFGQSGVYVKAQAYDIGSNTYIDSAMGLTDFNGQTSMYLNWYDTQYRFILIKNYATIKTTNLTTITETPTTIVLDDTQTYSFDKFDDFVYTLNWNNVTKIFTLTFTKPSLLVDTGCLRVLKRTALEDTQLCLNCESAASATIICDVSNQTNGTYIAAFYATGSYKLIDWIEGVIGGSFAEEIYYALGNEDASFYAFLFSGICMGAVFIHPIFAIIGLIMGMVGGAALGFTLLNYSMFIGITLIGGIVIWLLRR